MSKEKLNLHHFIVQQEHCFIVVKNNLHLNKFNFHQINFQNLIVLIAVIKIVCVLQTVNFFSSLNSRKVMVSLIGNIGCCFYKYAIYFFFIIINKSEIQNININFVIKIGMCIFSINIVFETVFIKNYKYYCGN